MVTLARSVAARAAPNPSAGEGFGSIGYKIDENKMNESFFR
ncbi:MAG: hypothetical protein WB392_14475 [Methanotrichaceae archaeon]